MRRRRPTRPPKGRTVIRSARTLTTWVAITAAARSTQCSSVTPVAPKEVKQRKREGDFIKKQREAREAKAKDKSNSTGKDKAQVATADKLLDDAAADTANEE